MRALVLEEGAVTLRQDYEKPTALAHEALVRVTMAGICSTDLEVIRGYVPGYRGVLGHEFCGVVEQSSATEWVGKRVCAGINCIDPSKVDAKFACCPLEHHPQRTVLGIIQKDGCFADYITVPVANLVEIPESVPDRMAVFVEPLAAALRIRDQVTVKPTAKIAVIGAGKLGMLIARVLQAAGNDVRVLGRSKTSFELPRKWGIAAELTQSQSDDSLDFVVEATKSIEGFKEALRMVKPMGTIVLKSTYAGMQSVDLTKVVVGEVTIVGSRCGPFPAAVRMLERQEIDVTDLIDSTYDLDQGIEALDRAQEKGVKKVLLKM